MVARGSPLSFAEFKDELYNIIMLTLAQNMFYHHRFSKCKVNSRRLFAWVVLLIPVFMPAIAKAGGGPENLFLVINANSQNSMEVGNHYARLQNLPASHVLHLPYEGDLESVSGDVFREQILKPIIDAINQRGLAVQIDMVTYSCDMPWRVDFRKNYPKEPKIPSERTPFGSTTGATYLWQMAFNNDPRLMSLNSNWYVPMVTGANLSRCTKLGMVSTRGFRGRYAWKVNGDRAATATQGRRYLMSTMLGVTTGRGNTVEEVIASLRRSSYANVVPPVGAFYYVRNKDVRSVTRHACYNEVVNQLTALGAEAYVTQGSLPKTSGPVLGMMLGKSDLPLHKAKFTVQPGAICEHLTSFGGMLKNKNWQTPITDLIRLGASGVSGTVTEPHAIQAKFPLPTVHLHYRRGSSLAEAFYQSVASPYQLLIIGDPLCQPWAARPQVTSPGWEPDGQVPIVLEDYLPATNSKNASKRKKPNSQVGSESKEEVANKDSAGSEPTAKAKQKVVWITPRVIPAIRPAASPTVASNSTQPNAVPYWELFIDGKLTMRLPSGKRARIVVDSLKPGWHELRCVGMSSDALESQGVLKGWINMPSPTEAIDEKKITSLADSDGVPEVELASSSPVVPLIGEVELTVKSRQAKEIVIKQFAREVARFKGSTGKITLPAGMIGKGPVRLQAYAEPNGAASSPLWIVVE